MRIKTQLSATLILIACAAVVTATLSWHQQQEIGRLIEGQTAVAEVLRNAQDLALLSNELLFSDSDRVRTQWRLQYQALGELLTDQRCCREARWQLMLEDLNTEHVALGSAFERLIAHRSAAAAGVPAPAPVQDPLASMLQQRSRRILVLLQELSASKRITRTERIEDMAVLSTLTDVTVLFLGALLLWLLRRRLVGTIRLLLSGFRRVANGDLRHRVDIGWRDEFGDLARGFDQMTEQLEKRSAELKASQDDLAAVNQGLEETVAARTAQLDETIRQLYDAGEEVAQSQRLATMGKLVASISHELNNPLMGALNYVQYVRKQLADERLDAWLDRAESEISRAADVVHSLLAFGRKAEERRQPVVLAPLVGEVLELARPALAKVGATAIERVAPDLPTISAQPKMLRQVLLNLVLNAADAVSERPQREILISSAISGDHINLIVEDSGPGVPQAIRGRIFEPFFSTKPRERSTGLGLAVARRLIEGSGGNLEYREGALGARFVIELPVADDGGSLIDGANEAGSTASISKPALPLHKTENRSANAEPSPETTSMNALTEQP